MYSIDNFNGNIRHCGYIYFNKLCRKIKWILKNNRFKFVFCATKKPYVATKSYKVLRYNSDTQASDTIYSSFTPYALTQADKDNILLELETVWYSHLENGACPGCQNKTWPNE